MSTSILAPEIRFDDEDERELFVAEFALPSDLDEQPDAERERVRYDEQILAALVSP